MKDLPYFRWWIARAETDERYSAMTDAELGFFHRCLNKAWVNVGLPADMDQLAKLMKVTREYLDQVWGAVGGCWYSENGRLFNKTQEEERSFATSRSKKATDAVRTRYGRSTDVEREKYGRSTDELPRAYDSDSVSVFVSSSASEAKKTSLREVPKPWPEDFDFEAWFAERDGRHPIPGMPQLAKSYAMDAVFQKFTPAEFNVAHDAWCEYWKTQESGIPKLAVFIQDSWYRKRPPIRDPPKSKSAQRAADYARRKELERQEELGAH